MGTDRSDGQRWVCRWCVELHGLRGRDLGDWPAAGDSEGIARHIESVHHIPVQRDGETAAQTRARFAREQPDADGPHCRCPRCSLRRSVYAEH